MNRHSISVTTAAWGGGTATSVTPINGEVVELRYNGGEFSGTATYTVTRADGGGTIAAYTATANPWQISPRQPIHTPAGVALAAATGGSALHDRIPVDGYVTLVVANGGTAKTDSVSIYVC